MIINYKYLRSTLILIFITSLFAACGKTNNNIHSIVYTSNSNENWDIYTIFSDGSNPTRITTDPAIDANPVWSPDGKQIAFQ
jgi:hypothetical protein